ncbi:hypothetical protein EDD16DRAFT_1555016 [Pisolithus croceorrhizus]|nr:hypothetical protein EDD16DRAFT_1555016 [Pisolithus croceorrhizus]
MVDRSGFDYQDGLIEALRSKGGLPEKNTSFVEAWRREIFDHVGSLKRGWKRLEALGQAQEWLEGVESETSASMKFDFRQLACSLLGSSLFRLLLLECPSPYGSEHDVAKSVAIVGGGSAGLAMLKNLLDLPLETRADWDIVLLHTNTPVPVMTYPGFPYPPGTPLYPSHEYIEQYHRDYATHYDLWPYIKAKPLPCYPLQWTGTSEAGHWDVVVQDHNGDRVQRSFDHLVVASGHNHEPHIVAFAGQETWLEKAKYGLRREILHSIWYRDPSLYVNRTAVVVGGGASGVDIASQVSQYARKVYLSVREMKPEISHFTSDDVVFADGSTAQGVDTILLGTGYELRVPFLEEGGEVVVKPGSNETDENKLTTNLHIYFRWRHLTQPTHWLFIGLLTLALSCPSDTAQSIYATSIIANSSLLPPRAELLRELADSEEDLRRRGYDPYYVGHKMVDYSTFDYQDDLIKTLRLREGSSEQNTHFVEAWRRKFVDYIGSLKRGWKRLEALGQAQEWLEGVESEEEWADLMARVNDWEKDWESDHQPLA